MKRVDLGHKIVMIDPTDCGSTVGYSIVRRVSRGTSATIDLADCNRKIQWYFSARDASPTAKIDAAITLLQEFRAAWLKALRPVKLKRGRLVLQKK